MCPASSALMTDQPPLPARVSRTGNPLLKPAGGPPQLTKRHHALIRSMVFGIDQPFPRWPAVAVQPPPHVAPRTGSAGHSDHAAARTRQTDVTLFDPLSEPPTRLLPGDAVRFVVAGIEE